MVRWTRFSKEYYFGFWWLGLLFAALQGIPYAVMPLMHLETNPVMQMPESSRAVAVVEAVLAVCCVLAMLFVVREDDPGIGLVTRKALQLFCLAMLALMLNYFGWLLYFAGYQSLEIIMLFLVMMPPLYYILIGLWRRNRILVRTASAFALVHFAHMMANFAMPS